MQVTGLPSTFAAYTKQESVIPPVEDDIKYSPRKYGARFVNIAKATQSFHLTLLGEYFI